MTFESIESFGWKDLHFKNSWCEKVFKSGRGLKLKKLFIVEHGRSEEVN